MLACHILKRINIPFSDFNCYKYNWVLWLIVCAVMQNAIEIDEDLLANSARSLETLVYVGMKLGVSKKQANVGLPNLQNCVLQD